MNGERKLRSNNDGRGLGKTLFDYDSVNRLIFHQEPIEIASDELTVQPYRFFSLNNLIKKDDGPGRPVNLVVKQELAVRRSKQKGDILDDSVYELFHRKMSKEEKSMANIERGRIALEVDNFRGVLQLLKQHDWARHLPSITRVRDVSDLEEMEWKRKMTIKDLEALVGQYEDWKRRYDRLNCEIRRFRTGSGLVDVGMGDFRGIEEFELPMKELKRIRMEERRLKYGPKIKLKLGNGYAIVIDADLRPRVIQYYDGTESGDDISFPIDENATSSALAGNSNQQHTNNNNNNKRDKNMDTSIPSQKIKLNFSEKDNIAFGVQTPTFNNTEDFSLSSHWKLHSDDFKQERMRFRNKLRRMVKLRKVNSS